MNYFKKLDQEFKITDYMQTYKKDFLKGDKEALAKKDYNSFLLGIRKTGTNLVVFKEENLDEDKNLEERIRTLNLWLISLNKRFFFGKNGSITEVCRDRAREIILEQINVQKRDSFLFA